MKKYEVTLYFHTNATITVEAENERDAVEKAREEVCEYTDLLMNGMQEDSSPDVSETEAENDETNYSANDDGIALKIWDKGYSEDELLGMDIVTWPESQDIMERSDYFDHCWLINDDEGLECYGSSAYVCESDWLKKN